ncbi:hypothetical protein M1D88_07835 [Arthrobacter sp. R1-13]
MKKLTTALLAAALTLSASACVAHPQLTNAETCERIRDVMSNPPTGKTGAVNLANQIRTIGPVSSDDLKSTVQALVELTDESAKDSPDVEKQGELQAVAQKNFGEFCPRSQ